MADPPEENFILGIDLGANSVGWALVARENGEPANLLRTGARVFEAAMEGDIESGKEESRNRKRRDARLHRRQLWRRGRRLEKVFHLLQRISLLPPDKGSTPEERQNLLNQLDKEIMASEWFKAKESSASIPDPLQVLPYLLRAAALDEKLEPHFLGRALYHLAQRRGFLSNRKQATGQKKKDEDEGVVYEGIAKLREDMAQANARTLGEYFCRIDPLQQRIRSRWTARSMYEDEFQKIWEAQAQHHPELLTEDRRKLLRRAIFHQRPLKIQRHLIGHCELEPERRRAPMYLLVSQRFRLLQKVNDLRILPPGEPERSPTFEEREKLLRELEREGDRTFPQIRKLLGLKKTNAFNLERGGEEKIPGNRTASQFYEFFGDRWLQMRSEDRDRLVGYAHGFQKPDKLKQAAQRKWQLGDSDAEKLSEVRFEADYMNLSRRAMDKLLPLLEAGVSYATARKEIYPERFAASEPLPVLPPVEMAETLGEIRNPAVMRSLTELRKVVNAILRQHGKPAEIRIELARDLRNTKKQREATWKKNRENEKARVKAARKILEETEIKDREPSRNDTRKVLLAEECGWRCPYTGKTISMHTLFGAEPQFDIEHILPFSRSLDNSFMNLTLCYNEENRNRKHDKTPWQAYGGDSEKYEGILQCVKQFQGNAGREKLRRFQMTETEVAEFQDDFSARQLNDTRYASRLAADYLGLLYGGRIDANGKRRIRSSAGQVTAYLRNEWKLNGILKDGPTTEGGSKPKSREDHRHHAVDAVVIALTDDGTIQQLSRAAERAPLEHRRRFASLEAPWPNFVDSVRAAIEQVIVSHRVSKKVSGALHEDTIYSPPIRDRQPDGSPSNEAIPHVRKPLTKLTQTEVEAIVDDAVREQVQKKLAELGEKDPKKAFAKEDNLPYLVAKDGRHIPIKRVRVKKKLPTFPLGSGRTVRHVTPESNHHLEVFAELDEHENEVEWGGEVVPMAEAYRRTKLGLPVVQHGHGPHTQFKFSLAPGELIECDAGPNHRRLFVVRSVSQFTAGPVQLGLVPVNDAGKKADIISSGKFLRPAPNTLRKWNTRKVVVGPLGEVSEAHD